jgi:hypothetical protein
MRRHRDVAEQVVVVHGATTDVGRATVLDALAGRARVVAVDTDRRSLAALEAEAATPHRLASVLVDRRTDETATVSRIAYETTARFGLLHTWVHVAGRARDSVLSVSGAASTVVRQLRRSGGGAFVVVAPDPGPRGRFASPGVGPLEAEMESVRATTGGSGGLVSVTVVRREGIVPPDQVARAALRAAVRPRGVTRVRGSARRDAVLAGVARLAPGGARLHPRPQGAWLLR